MTRAQSCGDSVSFMTLHSVPGEATTSRAYELSAEACQLLSVVKPDQNLVPEITLAANTR